MMLHSLRRLLVDDSAQEVVEYAYLSALVGLVGLLVWIGILGLLGDRYAEYDAGVQGLWEPPTPP